MMGKLIGAVFEFAVTQRSLFAAQRHRVGCLRRLRDE